MQCIVYSRKLRKTWKLAGLAAYQDVDLYKFYVITYCFKIMNNFVMRNKTENLRNFKYNFYSDMIYEIRGD